MPRGYLGRSRFRHPILAENQWAMTIAATIRCEYNHAKAGTEQTRDSRVDKEETRYRLLHSGTANSAHRAIFAAFTRPFPREAIVRQTYGDRLRVNPRAS